MKRRAPLYGILGVFAILAGCACLTGERPMGGKVYKPDVYCKKNGTCDLVVTVTSCDPSGSGINVPDLTGVQIGATPEIHWYLISDDYDFAPANAIKFKADGWQGEFSAPTGNKNKWVTKDQNRGTVPTEYPYSVTVVKKGGGACATKDPTIVNGL